MGTIFTVMEIIHTTFNGLVEFQPTVHYDERGHFLETYTDSMVRDAGINENFVQDNQSYSKKGVVRGLHYQSAPFAQAKLVRVASGKVLDIAVDLRRDSNTYGKVYRSMLDDKSGKMTFIPKGFAHGFLAIEDTILLYKCTEYYNYDCQEGIKWDDPDLAIDWGIEHPIVSEKDQNLPSFASFMASADHNKF